MMGEVLGCTEKALALGREIPVDSNNMAPQRKQPDYLESNFLKTISDDSVSKARNPEDLLAP